MLLTISTTHQPATDLGYLLHKHPARVQTFDLPFGKANVFYPEASEARCTCTLLLDVDPVGLVRGNSGPRATGGLLHQYVNDRPYAASSFLSVAIARVFGSALKAQCKERPQLAGMAIPLEVRVAVLPCSGGEEFLRRLFEPLEYEVECVRHPLDANNPDWGSSRYHSVTLRCSKPLSELLGHLYVLVPVLDDEKHYWVGNDEVEKLLRFGHGWLNAHPERDSIAARYLKHQRGLIGQALVRLMEDEGPDMESEERERDAKEVAIEHTISLNEQRLEAILSVLGEAGAKRVLDLGCGEGWLLRALLRDRRFEKIVGIDVSWRALEIATSRLQLDRLAPATKDRIQLLHGSLLYRDARLTGYDAAIVSEVIEHLDPARLMAFERVVFEFAGPKTVIITTPNIEFNTTWTSLPAGKLRHSDHRFEWTRNEFKAWASSIAGRFGYKARLLPVGDEDPVVGSPTQMGVFSK